MNLSIPKEPNELKQWMQEMRSNYMAGLGTGGDRSVVWFGNKLPQYLWDAWKKTLKPQGFTWPKFMRLLCHRTDISVLWSKGLLPWDEFVRKVVTLIEGPLGTELAADTSFGRKKPKG